MNLTWHTVLTVALPYPVSANRYWRTRVSKGIALTYVSAEAKAYKEQVQHKLRALGLRQPLADWVRVDLQLYPPCPKDAKARAKKDPLWWASTVQRLDLDNARKVLYDAFKGVVFHDDKQVWRDSGEVMEPRKDRAAGVVVRVSRAQKTMPAQPILIAGDA